MDYHPTKFAIKIPMKPTHLGNLGSVQHVFVVITGVGFFRTKIQTYFAGEDWTLDIQYGMGIRLGLFSLWEYVDATRLSWSRCRIQSCLVLTDSWVQQSHPIKGLIGKFPWGSGSLGPRQFGLPFSVQDARWQ